MSHHLSPNSNFIDGETEKLRVRNKGTSWRSPSAMAGLCHSMTEEQADKQIPGMTPSMLRQYLQAVSPSRQYLQVETLSEQHHGSF